VFFGGKYHMFLDRLSRCLAQPQSSISASATHSGDGIAWTKDASFLLPVARAGFNEFIVGEPGPVVFNNTLYLYFTAVGVDSNLSTPGRPAGRRRHEFPRRCRLERAGAGVQSPDQTVYSRASSWVGYSTPNAVVIAGKVHVFVDVANDHGNNLDPGSAASRLFRRRSHRLGAGRGPHPQAHRLRLDSARNPLARRVPRRDHPKALLRRRRSVSTPMRGVSGR